MLKDMWSRDMMYKTIRMKLHHLTNAKKRLLEKEYAQFQKAVKGKDAELYSATKQQADRVRKQKDPRNKQPLRLRNDVIKTRNKTQKCLGSGLRFRSSIQAKGEGTQFGVLR